MYAKSSPIAKLNLSHSIHIIQVEVHICFIVNHTNPYNIDTNNAHSSTGLVQLVLQALLFSPWPGLGAPLSSYLEVALYKLHR